MNHKFRGELYFFYVMHIDSNTGTALLLCIVLCITRNWAQEKEKTFARVVNDSGIYKEM